ncbi:hypothetical protein ACQEUV_33205 [Micromonospora aurantiaca (nom. illeg.)]|uniref:hypothetical protein n=1 Tax=Micromonospora aurantiaca (nom. illeg.) TaxID=47850 RepID=UPI003DA6082F
MTGVSLAAGTKPGPARPADTRPPAKPAQPAKPAKPNRKEGVTPAGTAVTPESRTRTNPLRKELVEMSNVPATPEVAQLPHVDRAMADAAGQDAVVRIARAGILRAVSRERYAVDQDALPAPETVTVHGGNRVSLLFDTAAEVIAWAERHGSAGNVRETHQVDPEGRRWCFTAVRIVWRGFDVSLGAAERASAVAA